MKSMASAVPQRACPPNGRYPFNIVAAEAGFTQVKNEGQANQRGGDSQIKLTLEIAEGEHAGYQAYDNLGTDGGTQFGSRSKKRLRALDVPGLDSDAEIPDDVIAAALLNRRVFAEVEREQREDGNGNKQFDVDEKTGLKAPSYRLRVLGYIKQPVAGQTVAAPGQMQAPVMQFPPQGQPQFQPQASQAPQGWPGAAPGGYAPPAPGAVPGGYAPQAAPGFPQVAPPPGWGAPPNGAVGAAPTQQPQLPYGMPPGVPGQPR